MYDKCYFCLDQLPKLKKESTASFFVNFGRNRGTKEPTYITVICSLFRNRGLLTCVEKAAPQWRGQTWLGSPSSPFKWWSSIHQEYWVKSDLHLQEVVTDISSTRLINMWLNTTFRWSRSSSSPSKLRPQSPHCCRTSFLIGALLSDLIMRPPQHNLTSDIVTLSLCPT